MKYRTTLTAALLLAVFGAYMYFFEYKKAEEEKKHEEEEKKVLTIDWEKLEGLELTNSHGTFLVKKVVEEVEEGESASAKVNEWRIEEPLKADAENSTINGLVRNSPPAYGACTDTKPSGRSVKRRMWTDGNRQFSMAYMDSSVGDVCRMPRSM